MAPFPTRLAVPKIMKASYFNITLSLQPSKVWFVGQNPSGYYLGVLDNKLKIVVDMNSSTVRAVPYDYNSVMINITIHAMDSRPTPLSAQASQCSTVPLMLLQPTLRETSWIGVAELGGIFTDRDPGTYHFRIELIDPALILGNQVHTSVLGSVTSKVFEIVDRTSK